MFVFTISWLITSSLPWFMDLKFQVPRQYCSFQHLILLSPLDTSTTECYICFAPTSSFILGLLVILLHSYPVAYWTSLGLGDSSFSVLSLCPFIQFMRFSQQIYWGGLPFPSPVGENERIPELKKVTSSLKRHCKLSILCWNPSEGSWLVDDEWLLALRKKA